LFRFIHTADIHLDSPLRGLEQYEGAPVEAIRGAARRALENLVSLAIDEDVAFVLVAGDLYDGEWKDYNTGLFLVSQLARLKQEGIRVFLISGNHDAASQITKNLRLPDNAVRFSNRSPQTVLLEELGVALHGQGYATRSITDDLSASYPDARPGFFNIGLLHTSITGREGHEPYAPCTVGGLVSKGYDYWALGHVHKREEVSRDPWIVFPGNIQGRHARETGAKGCTLVTVEDGVITAVEPHELDVVRWTLCEVDASGANSGDEVVARVTNALGRELDQVGEQILAARIRVVGATSAHAELSSNPAHWRNEIIAASMDLGVDATWIEKVQVRTSGVVDIDVVAARDDALGGLVRTIRDLQVDEERIGELASLFEGLRSKLPPELRTGSEPIDLQDAEFLREALDDAREMLLAGLLEQGGE